MWCAALMLAARDPGVPQRDIDVMSLRALHVRRPQPCGGGEQRHVGQVIGTLSKQALEFGNGQRTNTALSRAAPNFEHIGAVSE